MPSLTSILRMAGVSALSVMLATAPAVGQVAVVQETENFRVEPNGTILGTLEAGAALSVVGQGEAWVEVALEGWVWMRSLQTTAHTEFDLTVSNPQGENLRAEPQGTILARLNRATLVEQLGEQPGWARVRRNGWVWKASVRIEEGGATGPLEPSPPRTPATPPPTTDQWMRAGMEGFAVLADPDGDTLARFRPGAEVPILARQGNWVRVRMEGWVWLPLASEVAEETPDSVDLTALTPLQVIAEPEAYRGRVVEWVLQFVSLEEAENVRTDFYEGEPFLLTRTVDGDIRFVYVAIPPERMGDVQGLTPLERIRVVGRIRTGAAALTGNPILDLLELYRAENREE